MPPPQYHPAVARRAAPGRRVLPVDGLSREETHTLLEHYLRLYRAAPEAPLLSHDLLTEKHHEYAFLSTGGIPAQVFRYAMLQGADINSAGGLPPHEDVRDLLRQLPDVVLAPNPSLP